MPNAIKQTRTFPSRNGFITSLEGVRVGDEFMLDIGGRDRRLIIAGCESITEKQCVVAKRKYRIADAQEINVNTFHGAVRLQLVDKAALEANERLVLLGQAREALRDKNWHLVPNDTVLKIYKEFTS